MIQDAFKCCGLKNSRDMAWPFPDKTHKATACEEMYGYKNGCLEPWKEKEQRMAGILMVVVGLVFLWQVRPTMNISAVCLDTDGDSSRSSLCPLKETLGFTRSRLTVCLA